MHGQSLVDRFAKHTSVHSSKPSLLLWLRTVVLLSIWPPYGPVWPVCWGMAESAEINKRSNCAMSVPDASGLEIVPCSPEFRWRFRTRKRVGWLDQVYLHRVLPPLRGPPNQTLNETAQTRAWISGSWVSQACQSNAEPLCCPRPPVLAARDALRRSIIRRRSRSHLSRATAAAWLSAAAEPFFCACLCAGRATVCLAPASEAEQWNLCACRTCLACLQLFLAELWAHGPSNYSNSTREE